MTIWKPMHTAPLNGTFVALRGDSGYVGTPSRVLVGRYEPSREAVKDEGHPFDKRAWRTHNGDHLTDDGEFPDAWCHLWEIGLGTREVQDETTPSILRGFDPDLKEPPRAAPGLDGSIRRAHYGEGKQPWDTAVERGWAAKAAALMVIKYLRRDKGTPEKDLRDARWYFDRLVRMVSNKGAGEEDFRTMTQLNDELTEDELARLEHGR